MDYVYPRNKRFVEDEVDLDLSSENDVICNICGTFGHYSGECATGYKIIKLQGDAYMKKVELFTSLNQWRFGEPMTYNKYENLFKIYKNFPVGKYEFKFKVNGKHWLVSSFFPTIITSEQNVNNYIIVKPFISKEFTVVNKILEREEVVEVKFLLTDRSVKMMARELMIPMRRDIVIEIFGSWNDWKKGEKVVLQDNEGQEFRSWSLRKKLQKSYYEYKFKINGRWILDVFRESRINNGISNHFLDIPYLLRKGKVVTQEIRLEDQEEVNIEIIDSNSLSFFQLYGHSMNSTGSNIYIYGGLCRDSFINSVLKLNPDTMEVEVQEMYDPNSPQKICFHKTIKFGEKLIIYGGSNESKIDNKYYTYNTETMVWTVSKLNKNMPPRELFSIVHRPNTFQIYVFGGYYCSPDLEVEYNLNDLYVLHLDLLNFEEIKTKNPPEKRCNHSANIIGEVMYIFGGCKIDYLNKTAFGDMYKIALEGENYAEWQEVKCSGKSPGGRFGHLSLNVGPYILINGGMSTDKFGDEKLLWDLWAFDTRTESWSELNLKGNPNKLARYYHGGCIWEKNIFIFGGKFKNNANTYK